MITGTSPMDVGRHRKAVVDRLLEDLVVAVADCFESDPVLSWDAYKYLSMLVLTLPRRFYFQKRGTLGADANARAGRNGANFAARAQSAGSAALGLSEELAAT